MLSPTISAVRGAICVDSDNPKLIEEASCALFSSLLKANSLSEAEVASLLITQTHDLRSLNPATGLRRGGFCASIPLFCMQELEIEGMLARVIRMLLIINHPLQEVHPVYLNGAQTLRPDLK